MERTDYSGGQGGGNAKNPGCLCDCNVSRRKCSNFEGYVAQETASTASHSHMGHVGGLTLRLGKVAECSFFLDDCRNMQECQMPSGCLWTMEPADLQFYSLLWLDKMNIVQGNRTVQLKDVKRVANRKGLTCDLCLSSIAQVHA